MPQRAREAREQLVRERARLEPARDRLSGRPHVIGRQCLEQLAAPPEDAQVGTVDLVRRADEEVGAERGDVDRHVRRPVDRVDPEVRAGRMDAVGDLADRVDRADGVRRETDRDEPRPGPESVVEVVEPQRAVVGLDADPAHDEVALAGDRQPRRDVGVMVHAREDDLVAGREARPDRAAERERDRRHVRPEGDLVRVGRPEQVGDRGPRARDERVGLGARREGAMGVRAAVREVVADRVQARVGDLRARGTVEPGDGHVAVSSREGREARPDRLDVIGRDVHAHRPGRISARPLRRMPWRGVSDGVPCCQRRRDR